MICDIEYCADNSANRIVLSGLIRCQSFKFVISDGKKLEFSHKITTLMLLRILVLTSPLFALKPSLAV